MVEVQPEEPALPAAPSVETAAADAAAEARLAPNFGNIGSRYIRMGEKVDSIIQDTNAVFRAVRENGWNLFEPGSLNSHTFGLYWAGGHSKLCAFRGRSRILAKTEKERA